MSWCFAIVNNKLAEIYFEKKKNGKNGIFAHCYIKRKDFKTKKERKQINEDTKRVKVIYRGKKYKLINK